MNQGQLEFGSPVEPMTAEALVLHFIDNLDAKLAQLRQARKRGSGFQFLRGFAGACVALRSGRTSLIGEPLLTEFFAAFRSKRPLKNRHARKKSVSTKRGSKHALRGWLSVLKS